MTDIQWDQPLEAVHEDGRVVPMIADGITKNRHTDEEIYLTTSYPDEDSNESWRKDGSDWCVRSKWRIRNTPQQTPTPDVVGIAPELVERMVVLIRLVAGGNASPAIMEKARAIVYLLPESVDALEKCIAGAMCGNNVQPFEIANAIRHDRAALRALAAEDR